MPAPRFHPFARLIFCGIGLFGVSILLAALLYTASALATPWTNRTPESQLLDLVTRFALPLTILSYPASLLWIGICRRKFDGFSFVSLGLRPRRAGSDLGRGIATGALAIALLWLILWLTGAISISGWSQNALQNGVWISFLSLLGYALAFFAVGFFEETLFRGYLLHNLKAWLRWRGAVALQAILFAIVHLGNVIDADAEARRAALGALPSLFLIGVFFALSYRKTGSLWFPIGFHFAWNFCLGCVFSLPVSGIETFKLLEVVPNENSWFSGGTFGAEGSFYLIPILLALIYFISKAPDHPQALLDLELPNRRVELATPFQMPTLEAETPNEERENRYSTKFGTSQGFSADTLRELRELQEAREKAQQEAAENARRDARITSIAPPIAVQVAPEMVQSAPEKMQSDAEIFDSANVEVETFISTTVEEIAAPEVQSAPETVVAPEIVAPPVDSALPIKKKPPSPRW